MDKLTVTQFVELVNTTLAELEQVTVEGEVSGYKVIHQKWVVFDLKDEESVINCFMPVWNLKTQIEDGMLVKAVGEPKLRNKGFFSFTLDSVTPAGEGSLKRAFELLRKKLEEEGLFAAERKRALPRFPQKIALITSRDAAAYGDFLKVLKARMGGLEIYFLHTQVQGEEAPRQLLQAIEMANIDVGDVEAIVMARGGGSLEDLQAFNDERVVRAVAASRVPMVVGVGHERDVTLAELAADARASTPSNAAELLVRTRLEVASQIEVFKLALRQSIKSELKTRQARTQQAMNILRNATRAPREKIVAWQGFLRQRMAMEVATLKTKLKDLERLLSSLSPEKVLARGFSMTRTEAGKLVTEAEQIKAGEIIVSNFKKGKVRSRVEGNNRVRQAQLDLGM